MSLNRQRPRTRVNSRATTLPSLSNITANSETTNTTATTMDSSNSAFLPSIEESLQDWLTRSIPDTPSSSVSWLLDICRCCNQNDCENLEKIASTIRKLENDARLAAVIGQSLLQKHEQFATESDEMKQQLEQQVELLDDKIRELELSLMESDNYKQQYLQDKNKSTWECQKVQKALDETTSDLDICNNRCLQLGSELKSKNNEVEKLRIFKFMARQADIREDTLRAKLEDVKQELAVSRKAELTLESKHKKLRNKYESMCFAFEKLKLDQQEMGITSNHQLDLVWLRESNEKLRKDVLKRLQLTSALLSPTASDLQLNNNNQLIELIKELASANNKLKSDLLDCSDLLMECRSDLYAKQDNHMHHDDADSHCNDQNEDGYNRLSTSAPQKSCTILDTLPRLSRNQQKDETGTSVPQEGTSEASSVPIVHHHYHYYMRNKLLAEKGKNKPAAKQKSDQNPKITISSSSISKIDSSSPFKQLYNQVASVLQRLQQTDIRALNRRLRRAFDILELSSMSNSIIENIVTDVDGFRTRFSWVEDISLVKQEAWIHDISMLEFFPIIVLVQEMLKEIGQLRTTMNDLQVEYVKKVEESDIRLEEEVLRKQQQQQQQQQQQMSKDQSKTSSALSWLSNVFQRSPVPTGTKDRKTVQPMASQGSLHARFMASNISDVSVHSTSIHPLSKPKIIPSTSNSNTTYSCHTDKSPKKIAIRRQKSDIDRYGPPSSFPTRSPAVAIGNEKAKRRSTSTAIVPAVSFSSSPNGNLNLHSSTSSTGGGGGGNNNSTKVNIPLRASQSAGTVRRSQSMQAPALEYVVRRKRSTLGLSSSSSNDYDLPQTTSAEMAGSFATTSWLGNK